MDHSAHAPRTTAARRLASNRVLRWLYTNNPFYVLSADLVFIGLRLSFDTSGRMFQTGTLMLALLGYTLLLATTACLLIRLGKVWDDVRTILLLVVTMFLGMSVTFDETLARRPWIGTVLYAGGLLFAVAVSEGLLRGMRLKLPALFRAPYYLILALFFLYPLALLPFLASPDDPALQWLLFGFSPLAGLVFLTLMPAIRRGAAYVRGNGSPWPHPLYPWTLFVFLAAAVCGRSFYLCISFHFVSKVFSIFGSYFLVPFLFSLAVLLLEGGITSRSPATQRAALLAPGVLLLLAVAGRQDDFVYERFLHLLMAGLGGSPLFLTLVATIAFYAYAALRQVRYSYTGLTLSLFALGYVAPTSMNLGELVALQPLPLLAAAVLQVVLGLTRHQSWRCLVATGCLIAAIAAGLGQPGLGAHPGFLAYHLALACSMAIGAYFSDPLARWLQQTSAVLLALSCLAAAWGDLDLFDGLPPEALRAYVPAVLVVAAVYAYLTACRSYAIAAAAGFGGWLASAGWRGYLGLKHVIIGLDWITLGLVSFALAALISLAKTGLIAKWQERRARKALDRSIGGME
jgi:hypothetical protein